MRDEVFDPYRFDRVEIQSQADQVMLDRLSLRINEFKDLADIPDWESIKNDRAITKRLQEAHNIMHDMVWFDMGGIYRCCPCEMESLCAIKHLITGSNFKKNFSDKVLKYLDIDLDSEMIRKNIEEHYSDNQE